MKDFLKPLFVLIIGFLIVGLLFRCQLTTYVYSYQIEDVKAELVEYNCADDSSFADDDIHQQCIELNQKHNDLVRKWAALPCIDVDIADLAADEPEPAEEEVIEIVLE